MIDIPFITYTNKKCTDAWPIYFDLLKKYYEPTKHYIISDVSSNTFPDGSTTFIYKNTDPFYIVWEECLSSIQDEFFIYMQEDFFVYKPIDLKLMKFYKDILKSNTNISYIRLIKSGIQSNDTLNINTLYQVNYNEDYAFSMQPTIWRTEAFLNIQKTHIQQIPWDEPKIDGQVLGGLDIYGLYHYDNEPKRGLAHYDSNVFPYIATALVKGKWNTKEYPELLNILNEYKIDVNIRGEYV